ncbi:unnamed protein product, partial [Oikopleura dioica]
ARPPSYYLTNDIILEPERFLSLYVMRIQRLFMGFLTSLVSSKVQITRVALWTNTSDCIFSLCACLFSVDDGLTSSFYTIK